MKTVRSHTILIAVLLIACFGLSGKLFVAQLRAADKPAPKHARKSGAAPTAESLVQDMQKALAFIAISAKDKISVKSKEARPFWSALKTCSKSIDLLEEGVKGKNDKMIQGLDDLGGGMVQLAASWGILRGSHPNLQVGRGVIALNEAYETYLYHFGPAAARFHKGGKITDAELEKVSKCHKEVVKIQEALDALKAKAKKNTYEERLMADLTHFANELAEVDVKDLNSYCKFIFQWNRLKYSLEGYGDIVELWYPDLSGKWQTVGSEVKVMDTSFSSESWSYYESWSFTSVSIQKYGSYYEKTAAISSVTASQEESIEASVEAYSEESATEESEAEAAEINEEVAAEDDAEDSAFYEEVEDGEDDADGDGIADEDDDDDDNDGISDAEDNDDDGDGVADADDEDESGDDESMSDDGGDDDSDDDGVADADDGDSE